MIDNNFIHNVIYTTLLTVKYSKEAYARLKRENETTSSGIIRKRCRALMAKMTEPGLSSERIAAIAGCSRNFVDSLIHSYIPASVFSEPQYHREALEIHKTACPGRKVL